MPASAEFREIRLEFRAGPDIGASACGNTHGIAPADVEFARDAVAAECTSNVETVVIHDLEQLRRHREAGTVQNWNDRRRDLYKVVYREDEMTREV